MELHEKITSARKKKGFTQEQLADLANVTVRTIQRIESGESTPRSYTLKTIATALDINFEELAATGNDSNGVLNHSLPSTNVYNEANGRHFLQMLCLSCFSYLVLPFVHFLIPTRLLKRSTEQNPKVIAFARKVIRVQLYWKAALWLLMLGTLAYNITSAHFFEKAYLVNYLWPFFVMYFINAVLIAASLVRINKTDLSFVPPVSTD